VKIIFINRFFYPDHSATSQLLTDLAFYLAERGLLVEVVTSRQIYDEAKSALASAEFSDSVHIRRVWSTSFGRSSLVGRSLDYLTFYAATFIRLLKDTKPGDVLVAETDPPLISVVVAIVAAMRSAKLVNWVQDLFPEVATALGFKGMNGGFAAFLKRLRNWSLRRAAMNVVIGEGMRQRLINETGAVDKIRVIHNWSDSEQIRPVLRHENPLGKEWLVEDKFVVGYSGNMGRAHEFRVIMDAAVSLCENKGIVFLFIGAGAQLDWIKQEVSRMGAANVILKPYQSRKSLSYSLGVADIHLVSLNPALEGLIVPSKFYGIIAAGRATIFVGSKNGEVAGILENEKCGFTVGCDESEELVARVLELYRDRGYCNDLGVKARELFLKKYSSQYALEQWGSLLDNISASTI